MKRSRISRKKPLRRKFRNIPTEFRGVLYDSKLEAKYAAILELEKHSARNAIRDWQRQVPVKLEVNGKLITTYIVDFLVTHSDGHEEWVETKGVLTPEARIKIKLFRALFPDRKLTIVKKC